MKIAIELLQGKLLRARSILEAHRNQLETAIAELARRKKSYEEYQAFLPTVQEWIAEDEAHMQAIAAEIEEIEDVERAKLFQEGERA